MDNFAFIRCVDIRGDIPVYKLEKNGIIQYDQFLRYVQEEDKKYVGTVRSIQAIVEHSCLITYKRLPKTKFREIDPYKGHVLYEVKCGDLRLYLFPRENIGKILILFGFKGNQKKTDLKACFRTMK